MIRFYDFATTGTRLIALALARVEVQGLENLPRTGPAILAPNHLHVADPPVLGAFLPRKVFYMVKQEAWETPIGGRISRWFEAFPVRRGEVDLTAYRQALQLLADGQVVGIFPEGHRSPDGKLHAGQPGAVILARRSGAPIIPVGLTGVGEALRFPWVLPRRTIRINVGEAFYPGPARRDQIAAVTQDLMTRIARLLPPERPRSPLSPGAMVDAGPAGPDGGGTG
jgi:1-acyl-sn-glycerol-3-phosphate acyltransferase